jgi:hypothetical protein
MAAWMDLNGMADSSDHLRNAAAILRHAADKYRANVPAQAGAVATSLEPVVGSLAGKE